MSWRILISALLIIAGFSAWGGLSLGNWLVAHGPEAPPVPEIIGTNLENVLDSSGKPYVAQPPQPLVNGRLGVPEPIAHIAWEVPEKSLAHERFNSPIAIGITSITLADAASIAEGHTKPFEGIANVGDLISANTNAQQAIQSIEIPPIPPAPNTSLRPEAQGNWQQNLQAELQACSNVGFFSRPTCAWNARNKYCEPNNAWGKITNCPAKH